MRLEHLDVGKNPRLRGVPAQAPKQGCSGGAERYLRGGGVASPPPPPVSITAGGQK